MRDVTKDVSEDDARVVHGRTHTQAELAASRPLRLGGLRVLIALVVSNLFGIFTTYVVLRRPPGDAITAGFAGIVGSVAVLIPLALVLTGCGNPVDWLRQYWRRNVRGYAVTYWLDNQGKLMGRISCRRLQYWRSAFLCSPTIYLPLGGWLHRPSFVDRDDNLHKFYGVRVRWPRFELTPDKVWVADRDGAYVKLWMIDALVLWGARGSCMGHDWSEICVTMVRNLERLEREHQTALTVLLDVYDRIVATKRFIKSTQAKAIADDLRQKLNGLLPFDHPRSKEFTRPPLAEAAPVAAKT